MNEQINKVMGGLLLIECWRTTSNMEEVYRVGNSSLYNNHSKIGSAKNHQFLLNIRAGGDFDEKQGICFT